MMDYQDFEIEKHKQEERTKVKDRIIAELKEENKELTDMLNWYQCR